MFVCTARDLSAMDDIHTAIFFKFPSQKSGSLLPLVPNLFYVTCPHTILFFCAVSNVIALLTILFLSHPSDCDFTLHDQ